MRAFLAVATSLLVLAGCTANQEAPKAEVSPKASTTVSPESWVMSADAFGPITVATTKAEALATGAYRVAPSPCSKARLDWHSQAYEKTDADEDKDGTPDKGMAKPYEATITLNEDDKPEFIDPGPDTKTDTGIGRGDSLAEVKDAYGDKLIAAEHNMPDNAAYAVNGKQSYLLISLFEGKVEGFFITPGTVKSPQDVISGRGGLC